MVKTSALVAFLAISSASAFAPAPVPFSSQKTTSSLEMKKNSPFSKFVATASVASAILLSSTIAPDAQAITGAGDFNLNFGSDNVIAGRSGGRGGGRSSASSMRRSPPPSSYSRPTTVNNVSRTTVIQQSPGMVSAPVMASPIIVSPVISPFGMGGGYGMGYGGGYGALGAVNMIGREMREGRQEAEIRDGRNELQDSKQREFQLEQRLNQLEQNQANTNAVNAAMAGAR
uniref:Uncharacterized protein n=1 Tax=Chaetoceros debilis TaxID=122233 RepID=A0A7S3Q370_9STRA